MRVNVDLWNYVLYYSYIVYTSIQKTTQYFNFLKKTIESDLRRYTACEMSGGELRIN